MIQGTKYYKLDDAVKAAQLRTKPSGTLYIHPEPSINGLFVDWIVTGLKYADKIPTVTVINGKAIYNEGSFKAT